MCSNVSLRGRLAPVAGGLERCVAVAVLPNDMTRTFNLVKVLDQKTEGLCSNQAVSARSLLVW